MPLLNVAIFIILNEPVTPIWVVIITFNVGLVFYTLLLRSEGRLLKHINRLLDLMQSHADITRELVKTSDTQLKLAELEQKRREQTAQNTGEAKPKGQ